MSEPWSPDEAALAALAPLVLPALMRELGAQDWSSAKEGLRELARRDPLEANLSFVIGASAAFYVAEKDANPKVETFIDALTFVTTCLSVGYADIFARTQAGKLIASVVMTVGPALSGAVLDPPAALPNDGGDKVQAAILARLDDILAELRRQSAEPAASP